MFEKQCKSGTDLLKGASSSSENALKELRDAQNSLATDSSAVEASTSKAPGQTSQMAGEKQKAPIGVPSSPPPKRTKVDEQVPVSS